MCLSYPFYYLSFAAGSTLGTMLGIFSGFNYGAQVGNLLGYFSFHNIAYKAFSMFYRKFGTFGLSDEDRDF